MTHLVRQGLDHAPLLMQCNSDEEMVIKPIKFLIFWVKHPQFQEVVKQAWSIDFMGNPFIEFHAKLKKVKKFLAEWNRKTYENLFEKLSTLVDMIIV